MNEDSMPVKLEFKTEAKGAVSPINIAMNEIENINIKVLRESFDKIIKSFDTIASITNANAKFMQLSEINISLEIEAKAGFVLIGSASAGTKSSIQVTLKPK